MSDQPQTDRAMDRRMLDTAARAAWRGVGAVEPNPPVGCVIADPDGTILAIGHHRFFGGPHAEVDALERCRSLGRDPKGATAWVTLEPCSHTGKTPPCTRALIEAGVAWVVCALREPGSVAKDGADGLRAAGVEVRFTDASRNAALLNQPYFKRATTGLPWVIAKWAQTIDGRIATRTGESKWISCDRSRAQVHRLRARVDCIVTGAGTVKADDPALTVRGVAHPRRAPLRLIVDPSVQTSPDARLVRSAPDTPTIIACAEPLDADGQRRAARLESQGVRLLRAPAHGDGIDLGEILRALPVEHNVSTVMVESGPGLTGALLGAGLIDEIWVFAAPLLLGDIEALPPVNTGAAPRLRDAHRFTLVRTRRFDDDALLIYRKPPGASSAGVEASS